MRLDRRLLIAMLAPGLALAVWLGLGGILLRATLDPDQRAALGAALGPLVATHGVLPVAWWLVAAALAAWATRRLYQAYVAAPARLAAATRVLAGDPAAPDLAPEGAVGELASAINELAGRRRALQADMARLVDEASRGVAEQRDQLGALMAELNQSVVVCNLDGRILLYNDRARTLVRRLSTTPGGGAELIGLGRPIDGVIDRALIAHARETIERRLARGAAGAEASARFVTGTPAGHLLRVGMAPVRTAGEAGLGGFVLLLDDFTEEHEAQSRRDRQLLELTETTRASVASIQAALEMLDYPDLDAAERARFRAVVRDEVAAIGARLAASAAQEPATRWPLQEMLGADLVVVAARRIEAETGQPVATEVDPALWLSVDSFGLIQALAFLAGLAAHGRAGLRLRLAPAGARAHLDLAWSDERAPEPGWQGVPMQGGAATVREVAERHGGEVWLERDRAGGSLFRFLLPQAGEPAAAPASESRPEFYDFDLFARSEASALDDLPLGALACTVFDTETTGLDPLEDEIIQIGAARIVNGRLLRGERFDQLVDPGRSIPEAGIRIHGIRPEMLRGQPTIAAALPAFHAFARESVLVGHNVAFDMRFLQLKEAATGVRFDQPVLDTLLLSSLAHPGEAAHGLEAIAGRLGLSVSGRHTALGDALTTAEVFLKLVPLLRQRGIVTLGQARTAAQASYFARLKY